jgi:hypothetical protein
MRIGWYSNSPHIPSGYGQQSAQVVRRLKRDGHEVAVMSNYGAAVQMEWHGIPVFPDGLKQYSVDLFPQTLKMWGGISIGLFDAWPMVGVSDALKQLNLAWWVPVDHDPVPPGVIEFFSKTGAHAIAMTKFGKTQLLKAGMPEAMVTYVPHAIDTKLFDDQGKASRAAMQVPEHAHLIGIFAANRGRLPVRKAFGPNLDALVQHLKKHEDAYAYLHTEPLGLSDGMNLVRYLQLLDAPMDRFRWPDALAFRNGIPNEALPHLYSACDVVLATSMGEGFGVPTVEAQSCGTPVVISRFAGSEELAGHQSHLIGGQREWDEFQGSWWTIPAIAEILVALDDNYRATKQGTIDRAAVREWALQYDADTVYAEHWKPLIEVLAQRGQPVKPNRAERRAGGRSKS